MSGQNASPVGMLLGVFFFGGLALAIVTQVLVTRRRKRRRGFPVEPEERSE